MSAQLQLLKIDSADLPKLQKLFSQSAGFDVNIQEEIDYFSAETARTWFYILEADQPVGFIRCFPQATWGCVELFVDKSSSSEKLALEQMLLKNFLAHASFDKGFRLRVEIAADNQALIDLTKNAGFTDRIEHFCHYEKNLAEVSLQGSMPSKAQAEEVTQVKAALENLHPMEEAEVASWITSGNIYIQRLGEQIVSATQFYNYGDSGEINRIATNPLFLKQGSAFSLLNSVARHLKLHGVKRVFLKVDQRKKPARGLYEKCGYFHVSDRDQVWLSKIF